MIKHFLGHKFIERKSNGYDEYYLCIECGMLCLPGRYYSEDRFYYFNENDDLIIIDISCDEFVIKKLLE